MTMEFLYRNATPVYGGSRMPPTQPTGLLAGLGSLFGCGATPAYKTVSGTSAQAPAPVRSLLQAFAVTPSYKTAPPRPVDIEDPCEPPPDDGGGAADPANECDDQALQVVIL
jgi:hypothetical protein